MAAFIEITTDEMQSVVNDEVDRNRGGNASGLTVAGRAGAGVARRPTRGLEIKEDTYAVLKVIQADGTEVPLYDSSDPSGRRASNTNFILQSVQEARMEKNQIVDTFGASYIFFFGEAPRFLEVQAKLINSNDFNWEAEWWANYEQYLRGTRSVELGARTFMFYDDTIVTGYILQAQAVKTSMQPLEITLSFRFFLTSYDTVSLVGDPNFPIHSAAQISLQDYLTIKPEDLLSTPSLGIQRQLFSLSSENIDSNSPLFFRDAPYRSSISDNSDEYVGTNESENAQKAPVSFEPPGISDTEDIVQAALADLEAAGLAFGSVGMTAELGLSAKFGASAGVGIGAGLGASASAGATFGASASAGASAGAYAGAYAGASASAFASASASASASAYAGASAGASASAYAGAKAGYGASLFGAGGQASATAGAGWTAGAYAAAYGSSYAGYTAGAYAGASAYAGANAQAYAGAYAGFGSGSLPSASANYFKSPQSYQSGFTAYAGAMGGSAGASYGGGCGTGASTSIGGTYTAFAMTTADGTVSGEKATGIFA